MTSSNKKIIAVMGATGAQGGGVIRAILADDKSEFAIRAVTRDVNSEAAKALAKRGVEVVAADIYDTASLERAFSGAHGVFGVTFFWAHMSGEKEFTEASNLARAAKNAGVKHFIWSTLDDTRKWLPVSDTRMPTLQGKYNVPHFDAKGEADEVFRKLGVPTTFLNTSFYWENFIFFGQGPKPGPDGTLTLTLPMGDKKLPGIASDDIGKVAYAIFQKGPDMVGKTIGVAGGHLTGEQMAAAMSKAFGQPVKYNEISPDTYRGFGFPGADEMGNMYQIKRDFNEQYCAARDIEAARKLVPSLQSFETWLEKNAKSIPLK
ncbi:MAG TPA: NmrA/HSCARG family protein [Polyangiaceae bacterium]|nr:NmrA/HSCARG family protein [Polyangiaceae bacterium]